MPVRVRRQRRVQEDLVPAVLVPAAQVGLAVLIQAAQVAFARPDPVVQARVLAQVQCPDVPHQALVAQVAAVRVAAPVVAQVAAVQVVVAAVSVAVAVAVAAVAVAAAALPARSVVPARVVRFVDARARSSADKSSTRWMRRRSVASRCREATVRPFVCIVAHR